MLSRELKGYKMYMSSDFRVKFKVTLSFRITWCHINAFVYQFTFTAPVHAHL